jgi:rhodanese-related sulfurtransferase
MNRSRIRHALATAGALVAVIACAGDKKDEPFTLVTVDQVEQMLARPDVFVVDANPEDVFRKNHLPGARWWRSAPLAQLLPTQKDQALVFYCASPS